MRISYSAFQTFIYSLYLISGLIKFVFEYFNFPIDITLLFGVLIVLDIISNVVSQLKVWVNSLHRFYLSVFFGFYFLFFVSLVYTKSESYAYQKTFYFLLTVVAFVYPIFIRHLKIDLFAKIFFCLAVPSAIWFILVKYLYLSGFMNMIGEDPRTFLGSYIGLSTCMAFLVFYFSNKREYWTAFLLMILQIALGGRGGLIFTILVLLAFNYKAIFSWLSRPVLMKLNTFEKLAFLLLLPLAYYFKDIIMEGFKFGLRRFESFVNFSSDNSSNERVDFYQFAISKIFDSPSAFFSGHGIGSFGLLFTGTESRDIPHNIYLEAWVELGFFGLLLLSILTLRPFLLKHKYVVMRMMMFFVFLDAMKSGGFHLMRFTFGIYGCLIFLDNENYSIIGRRLQDKDTMHLTT